MISNNIRCLGGYVIQHTKSLIIVLISLFSVACALLSIGFIFRKLVDNGLSANEINQVHHSVYLISILIGVFSIGSFFRAYYINVIAVKVVSKLKSDTYSNLLKVGVVCFEDLKVGEIISRLGSDIEITGNLIINFLSFFIRNFIMLLGAIILMFIQSPKLSLFVLISIPVLLIPLLRLSKYVRKLSRMVLSEQGKLAANIEESFAGVRTLYAYNKQDYAIENFVNRMNIYVKHASTRLRFRALFFALAIAIIAGSITTVIWIGSIDIIQGSMSSGQMISFIYYAIIVGMSAGAIAELFSELQEPLAALERVIELKNMDQIIQPTILSKFITNNYVIKFNKVIFAYPSNPDILALKNVSLLIQHGKFTGIVGKSGSGKSTLMQLLLKFYPLQSGVITLGGKDISTLQDRIIRSKIAYVDQYPTIFSGTIRSNIAFSNPTASNNNIEKIAKLCGILEFTKNLENGLDTEIGERGIRISGGQKQRLAIARALLYKPEILLLDEATSALDNESEQKILQQINALMAGKTIVSIAHRISSIENADEILVIHQGTVAHVGTHLQLLKSSKLYNVLYKEQEI